jgi:hypothetical protein
MLALVGSMMWAVTAGITSTTRNLVQPLADTVTFVAGQKPGFPLPKRDPKGKER